MLTPAEKESGRRFRARQVAELARTFVDDPPTYTVPVVAPLVFRHSCPARGGRSTALHLDEVYLHSPADPEHKIPADLFGFIYRAGICRMCGQTARSDQHRLVLVAERPPLHGRR